MNNTQNKNIKTNSAVIKNNGVLVLNGICSRDIVVNIGGTLILNGIANGLITNQGGTVEILGTANNIHAIRGRTIVTGIVNNLSGGAEVIKNSGSIISGIQY